MKRSLKPTSRRLTPPADLSESELQALESVHDPLGGLTRVEGARFAARASAAAGRERRRQATTEWLTAYWWDIFVTFTWRPGFHSPERSKVQVWKVFEELSKAMWGPKWDRNLGRIEFQGLYACVAWEHHQNGALHAHAIVGRWDRWKYEGLHDRWNALAGHAWVKPLRGVEGRQAVIAYTVKYCVKGNDLDFFGTWPNTDWIDPTRN